ncbi:MAG: hypothetical protein PHF21_01905 [Bacilli bacterium]|nr:hypothetical protein [Bacilli bacterium]
MIKRIIGLLLSLLLFAWIAVIATDYYLVTSEKDPQFCVNSGVNNYFDGTVKWCTGLGYKVFNYDRDSIKAIQFGPAWIKEKAFNN